MKNKNKGITLTLILIIIAVIIVAVSVYAYISTKGSYEEQESPDATTTITENFSTTTASSTTIALTGDLSLSLSGISLELLKAGIPVQTITLQGDALDMATAMASQNATTTPDWYFVTNLDVNFDGVNDVGVFEADGYGGVNEYYQFYVFNPTTERLEKNDLLDNISNPSVDATKKAVRSSYRSGPEWFYVDYAYNGTTYVKSKEVSAEATAPGETYSWSYQTTDPTDDGNDAPETDVTLNTVDKKYDAGTYSGTCTSIAAADLLKGEVSGVLCWWAGGGDEVGIFTENGQQVLKHGEQQEGTADGPGFRGNFKTITQL